MAEVLRTGGYRVAEVKGHIREGDLTILGVEIPRRDVQKLIRLASAVDERCDFIVHDIRLADFAKPRAPKANKRKRSWLFPLEALAAFKRGISYPTEEQMLILLWYLAGYVFIFTVKWDDGAS